MMGAIYPPLGGLVYNLNMLFVKKKFICSQMLQDAERPGRHSHAERGNEKTFVVFCFGNFAPRISRNNV